MDADPIEAANALLREKGYAERDLAVHAGPRGKALLKGNKIISPFSDDAALVNGAVLDLEQYPMIGRNPPKEIPS